MPIVPRKQRLGRWTTGLKPKRTSVESPWQNGIAERWVGSYRREFLDHDIALNEEHLGRLTREYVNYHHEDRTHDLLTWRCRALVVCTIVMGGAPRHSIWSHLNFLRLAWAA